MLRIFRNQVLIACTHEINIGNTIEFGKCCSGKVDEYRNISHSNNSFF